MTQYPTYAEYKATNIERLTELPKHWDLASLRRLLTEPLANGLFKKREHWGSGTKIVNVFDAYVDGDVVNESSLERVICDDSEQMKYAVKHGDFLFVRSSLKLDGIGKSTTVLNPSEPLVFECHLVRGCPDKNVIEPKFLCYFLNSSYSRQSLVALSNQVTMATIDQEKFKSLPVAIPPIEEQQAITRFLDFKTAQIDALIAKKKALLDKLAEKRTALISHAVTKGLDPSVPMKDSGVAWLGEVPSHWTLMRARYASTFVTSGSRGWAEYYSDSGSVFLRITNVSRNSVDLLLHDIQRVSPPESSEGERTATQSGDVIVSITADLGSVAVIPEGFESAYVSQHLALVRPNVDRVSGRWMAYQFFSTSGQAQLTGSGYGGTKIQLGLGDVKDVWMALPPENEQEAICAWLGTKTEQLQRQSDSIQDVILRLQEYRSALITNAVTGKIDVRGFHIPTHPHKEEVYV